MQITRQADYAVRAVRHLAILEKQYLEENPEMKSVEPARRRKDEKNMAATSLIAKEQDIPASFLAKIISTLLKARILETSRGARGGVSLARPPEEITLLEVVEAIDGPILLNECVDESSNCTNEEDCPLKPIWSEAQAVLVDKLRSTTFDQISNGRK
ncbi:MAG: RrF2 family transcriptional regulator [Anaerolineales bacterium]|jgi:Rrf2 family protein